MDQKTFEMIKDKAIESILRKYFNDKMKPNEKVAMHRFLEELLDEIMKGERSIFLENSMNNKGNGYYPRELTTGSWRLNINVPQDAGDGKYQIIKRP